MYFKYLKALLKHKWVVFIECCKRDMPFRGIMHDMSKFLPSEFIPYAQFFYGKEQTDKTADAFELAWLKHQKRNKHHWQWWVINNDSGGYTVLEMPDKIRKELLSDWIGANRNFGEMALLDWYIQHRKHMILNGHTREWIEENLGYDEE